MKVLIETYGRLIIAIVCVLSFVVLITYTITNSKKSTNDNINRIINEEETDTDVGIELMTNSKTPYIDITDSYQTSYAVLEDSYILRNQLLNEVSLYDSKEKNNILSSDDITISVYKEEIQLDSDGNPIFKYEAIKNEYGNYLRDSSGNVVSQNTLQKDLTYLGFVPTESERNEYNNKTEEEKASQDEEWQNNGIKKISKDGICTTFPGKYKIIYRAEIQGKKCEEIRYIYVE